MGAVARQIGMKTNRTDCIEITVPEWADGHLQRSVPRVPSGALPDCATARSEPPRTTKAAHLIGICHLTWPPFWSILASARRRPTGSCDQEGEQVMVTTESTNASLMPTPPPRRKKTSAYERWIEP